MTWINAGFVLDAILTDAAASPETAVEYRTLLVHVDASAEGRSRLGNAVALAKRLDAALIGVGAVAFDPYPDPTGASERALQEMIADSEAQASRLFHEHTEGLAVTAWRRRDDYPARALAHLACGADLVVGSRRGDPGAPELFAQPDDLILTAGAPVLLQPPAAAPLEARRVVVGWKNTRESRRAIWDSLPLLRAAEHVRLIRFGSETPVDLEALQAVADCLARHEVKVEATVMKRAATSVARDLIDAAAAAGADLIVTGAYGQPRMRELILGGVTSGLLASAPIYLLFSH